MTLISDRTPFICAVEAGNFRMLKCAFDFLFKERFYLQQTTVEKYSLLHLAVFQGKHIGNVQGSNIY